MNWAFNIAPSDRISIDHVAIDSRDNVIINGDLIGVADFDPSDDEHVLLTENKNPGVFVASYSSEGRINWAFNLLVNTENLGERYNATLFNRDIAIDHSDNILVMGSFNHSVDFDPSPATTIITARKSERRFDIRNTFIASYSSTGSLNWVRGFDTTRIDGNELAIDSANNFVIAGDFSNSVDFDLDSGTANLNASDRLDVFAASYRAVDGAFNWVLQVISRSNDIAYGIALDEMDNVFITGEFEDSADFDPNFWTSDVVSNGKIDLFLAKYSCCPK